MSCHEHMDAGLLGNETIIEKLLGPPDPELLEGDSRDRQCYEERCAYCSGDWDVAEHVTPIRKGGGTTFVNCLPAGCGCNSMKRSRTLEEWIATCEGGENRLVLLQRALEWLTRHGRGAP